MGYDIRLTLNVDRPRPSFVVRKAGFQTSWKADFDAHKFWDGERMRLDKLVSQALASLLNTPKILLDKK